MVVHVTRYEPDDLNIRTGKTEFLGCWILEAICGYTNEELYSSLTVVRRVVQGVLKHKKFKATPSFVRHTHYKKRHIRDILGRTKKISVIHMTLL